MNKLIDKFKKSTTDPQLLLVIFFAFFTNGMLSTMLGSILPSMKAEYNMNYTLSGMVLSAHQVGNLTAVFVAGFLPYLIGRKKSTLAMGAGTSVGMLLMALTGNPALLLIAFVATGAGRGTMSNISNVVVSEITKDKTRSLNVLHATFAVGALLAPFIAMLLTGALGLSWKFAAGFVSLMGFAMLLIIGRSGLSNVPAEKQAGDGGKSFLKSFRFWICTGILFFYLCSEATIVGWLVTYFKDSGIMTGEIAQMTSSLLWAMVMIGRLLCAAFSGRVDKRKLIIVMAVCKTFFFVLLISSRDIRVIFPALLGLGVSMAGIYPTTLSCMDARFTSSTMAMGACISMASFGAIIMPTIVGAIAEKTTIEGGMAAISVALVILVALTIVNYATSKPVQVSQTI